MENITLEREGKTLALSVAPDDLNDMELFEDLCALDEGKAHFLPRVVRRFLGEEQKTALYEFLRGDDGRVTIAAVSAAILEIFEQVNSAKK